jgi:DNA-binding NarL/FixJ family response regulator
VLRKKKGERYKVQNDGYLYINYLGLQLCIEHCVPVGRVLNAIRQEVMGEEKEPQVHIPVSNEEMSVILALHEKGLSCAEIAKHLGHKDRTRVAGALSRYQKKQSA